MKLALVFLYAGSLSAAAREEPALPRLDEIPSSTARLSVEEAYAAIPHRRTIFGFTSSVTLPSISMTATWSGTPT